VIAKGQTFTGPDHHQLAEVFAKAQIASGYKVEVTHSKVRTIVRYWLEVAKKKDA